MTLNDWLINIVDIEMHPQTKIFMSGLGDIWFERNRINLGVHDYVSAFIETLKLNPQSILELGCSNGWRLKKLREKYNCRILGIDPSEKAIKDANDPEAFWVGCAEEIPQ